MADLVTLEEARSYLGEKEDTGMDERIDQAVKASSAWLRRYTGKDLDQQAYVEVRDGNGRPTLGTRRGRRPIAAAPLPVVTENGAALVVAVGYSSSADVVVDLEGGFFTRRPGSTFVSGRGGAPGTWAPGIQNVSLTYTAGHAAGSPELEDARAIVLYLTAMLVRDSDSKRFGVRSRSIGGVPVEFLTDLPELYRKMADRLIDRYQAAS